jgi:hypothetical protein
MAPQRKSAGLCVLAALQQKGHSPAECRRGAIAGNDPMENSDP